MHFHSFTSNLCVGQFGALVSLAILFGVDSLRRKDRMVGWISLSCLLLGSRYAILAAQANQSLPFDLTERAQAIVASFGFAATTLSFWHAFRTYFWFRLPVFLGVFLGLNLLRCLFLPLESVLGHALHLILLLTYPLLYSMTLKAIWRAFKARDPMSRRLVLSGFLLALLPLLAEVGWQILTGNRIPVGGIGAMFMAVPLGVSWYWVIGHSYEIRIQNAQAQAAAWRSLVPGTAWYSEEPSSMMEALFGDGWAARLRDRMMGRDGRMYRMHRIALGPGNELGWVEPISGDGDAEGQFLKGWRVALGLDDRSEREGVRQWLEAWGAEVELWGTVPPREGPYPSLLIWGREPSILSVWREYDLARRRSRWVQVGRCELEGPHARLDSPVEEGNLRRILETLLELRQ